MFRVVRCLVYKKDCHFNAHIRWHRGDICMFLFISCAQHTKSCARDNYIVRTRYYVVRKRYYVVRTRCYVMRTSY